MLLLVSFEKFKIQHSIECGLVGSLVCITSIFLYKNYKVTPSDSLFPFIIMILSA